MPHARLIPPVLVNDRIRALSRILTILALSTSLSLIASACVLNVSNDGVRSSPVDTVEKKG